MRELCELCDRENIRFISDEIYHGITYPTTVPKIIIGYMAKSEESTSLQFSNSTIVINSFSKYYSMSGFRLGWLVAPDDLIESMNALQQNMFINAPTLSQLSAERCFDEDTDQDLRKNVKEYKKARAIILRELKKIGIKNISPADGAFYIYVDIANFSSSKYNTEYMCDLFLDEERVAFTPGSDFESVKEVGLQRFRINTLEGLRKRKKQWKGLGFFSLIGGFL